MSILRQSDERMAFKVSTEGSSSFDIFAGRFPTRSVDLICWIFFEQRFTALSLQSIITFVIGLYIAPYYVVQPNYTWYGLLADRYITL